MTFADIVIIAIVALVFGLALRKVVKNVKSGRCCSCSDGCGSCGKKCH